jgi:hypothetical protein
MGRSAPAKRGEFILLGVFGAFIAIYLFDVRRLPMEGKILSYVLALPMIGFLVACTVAALRPRKKASEDEYSLEESGEGAEEPEPAEAPAETATEDQAALGLGRTILMGCVLFGCIFLFGFYFGSGLMLLAWFALFRRLSVTTIIITVATPSLLYVLFEHVMPVGLYEGYLVQLLQR